MQFLINKVKPQYFSLSIFLANTSVELKMSDAAMILMRHYYMLGFTAADALKRIWSTEGQSFVSQFMIYKCYKKFKESGVPILSQPGGKDPVPAPPKSSKKRGAAKTASKSATSETKIKKPRVKKCADESDKIPTLPELLTMLTVPKSSAKFE